MHNENILLIISVLMFIGGTLLKKIANLPPIPANVITYIQVLAFLVTITAGLITIFKKKKR